ncbi:hypothetical protein ES703_108576 [subsurface metagenome]
MKRFFKKRWLGLPIGIITIVLLVLMLASTALAVNGYVFFKGNVDATVREAIAVGAFDTWDNLHPYGSDVNAVWDDMGVHDDGKGVLGDVAISIAPDGDAYKLTITHFGTGETEGTGFVAGEWIVIPVNLRNGSSVALDLGADASAPTLILDYCWLTNTGTVTEGHVDGDLNYDFRDNDDWKPLNDWIATIPGYGGHSGSARLGALVLFVKITAPQDIAPGGPYTATFSLARGVQ